jgi:hypothetical protein
MTLNSSVVFKKYYSRTLVYVQYLIVCGLLSVVCGPLHVSAQGKLDIRQHFMEAGSGTTLTLQAFVHNTGHDTIAYTPTLTCAPFQLLTAMPRISVAPGGNTVITATVYVPRGVTADHSYKLRWELQPANKDANRLTDTVTVALTAVERVFMQLVEPDVYLHNGSNEADIAVRCSNTGNTSQPVLLTIADPLQPQKDITVGSFVLKSFSDSLVHVKVKIPAGILTNNRAQLRITGHYGENSMMAVYSVNVLQLTNSRNYTPNETMSIGSVQPQHVFGLASRMTGTQFHYMDAQASGGFNLSENNRLGYQADARYFTHDRTWMLINTFLNYQSPRWDATAGSIIRSYEMMLSGRGVAATFKPTETLGVEAGYINGNYDLLGQYNNFDYKPTDAFFLHTGFQFAERTIGTAQFIYQRNPFGQTDDALIGGGLVWTPENEQHHFDAAAYTSYSTTSSYVHDGKKGRGVAGTFNYSYTAKRLQLISRNYYSSPLYAGLQKGALNLEEKAMYTPAAGRTFWLRYSQYQFKPSYISPLYNTYTNNYFMRTVEAGMSQRLNERWQMSIKPYYYEEYAEYGPAVSLIPPRLKSVRLNGDIRFQGKAGQNFWVNADAGYGNGNIKGYENFFAYRINAGCFWNHFTFNAFIQEGAYQAGDMNVFSLTGKKYSYLSFSPGYNRMFFRNKLMLNIYDYVTYQSIFNRWYNNFSVNANYRIRPRLLLEAGYNTIRYGFGEQLNSFDVGIRTLLGASKIVGGGKLEILFFEDLNGNYRWDAGEPSASNVMVRINQDVFITGNNGIISCRNMPHSRTRISILQAGGYFASDSLIWVNGKTHLQIPLHKMGVIQGRIVLDKDVTSYNTDENVAFIVITAKDPLGKRFTARTNELGIFTLYVPANKYTVGVDATSLPEKYEYAGPPSEITLTTTAPVEIGLHVQVQKRPVKVIRFAGTAAR